MTKSDWWLDFDLERMVEMITTARKPNPIDALTRMTGTIMVAARLIGCVHYIEEDDGWYIVSWRGECDYMTWGPFASEEAAHDYVTEWYSLLKSLALARIGRWRTSAKLLRCDCGMDSPHGYYMP